MVRAPRGGGGTGGDWRVGEGTQGVEVQGRGTAGVDDDVGQWSPTGAVKKRKARVPEAPLAWGATASTFAGNHAGFRHRVLTWE